MFALGTLTGSPSENKQAGGVSPKLAFALTAALLLSACGGPAAPGPDKQGAGELQGALTGAGAGAVTGFQLGVGTGPGALVGAGLGAVAGGIQGFAVDQIEEETLKLESETRAQRDLAQAQEQLAEHYKRRIELHPDRDIFPADWFFCGDETRLRPEGQRLVTQIANMNKARLPWSRLAVTAYAKASSEESEFAKFLTERRAREIADYFVKAGLEPRRLEARGVIMDRAVLVDPADDPARYNQAIEITPLDR